jgi:hypothetical protein
MKCVSGIIRGEDKELVFKTIQRMSGRVVEKTPHSMIVTWYARVRTMVATIKFVIQVPGQPTI